MSLSATLIELFETRGHEMYFGEEVSILEHSLQAAYLAEEAGASRELILAALLHDVGHLLHNLGENAAENGIDTRHEIAGEAWIRTHFDHRVSEPVRLHVDAKRYLCFADRAYLAQLSAASVRSLRLQGGPFAESEARNFEKNPYFRDAVALRRWDDAAKIPGLPVPDLDRYFVLFEKQ